MSDVDAGIENHLRTATVPDVASAGAVTAAAAGLAAGWIAAGSAGLLAHSFRHGLTWAALGVAALVSWPRPASHRLAARFGLLALAGGLSVFMIASPLGPLNVLGVALILVALAHSLTPPDRSVLLRAAQSVLILAIYRLAYTSIPSVWYAADGFGRAMGVATGFGRWVGVATGWCAWRPLWIGATMGGVDYLVPMLFLAVVLPFRGGGPKVGRPVMANVIMSVAAVLAAHFFYLLTVAFAGDAVEAVEQSGSSWLQAAMSQKLIWDLPALAAIVHGAIAWGLFRHFTPPQAPALAPSPLWRAAAVTGVVCLAAAIPLAMLDESRPSVVDKKIVFFKKGFLNWLKPEHGNYGQFSPGMYGMLPTYLESFGARPLISEDLSESDLEGAAALVIIYPNEPWEHGQLERIKKFVQGGGSLMVMGEHTVREMDGGSRINDVLAPTAMRVRFDSAIFAIGGWLHSYEALAHPTSAGIGDEANQFGVVIGGSVDAHWPARPLLVGRFGWADEGDASKVDSHLGNWRYDAGEKLGDVILAAEQPFGAGKVICFGDPSMLTNALTVSSHEYTSRLFTYLIGGKPSSSCRQMTCLAGIALLVIFLLWNPAATPMAAATIGLGASLAIVVGLTHEAWEVVPDGGQKSPNNLAYIDAAHLGVDSPEAWRDDGLGPLQLTLMRNGYLTLSLSKLTRERLDKAGLLFIGAPAREYSPAECAIVRDFAEKGGIVIITVGYDRAGPSARLLSTLGLHIGSADGSAGPTAEKPGPLGYFKRPFFDGVDYVAWVRFYAGWPISCDDPNAVVVAKTDSGQPVIIVRLLGRGAVALIGDTCFAMKKNLENTDGSPIEGLRENAVFWRWFLSYLGGGELWYPPEPKIETPAGDAALPGSAPMPAGPASMPPSVLSPRKSE